ncbi:unnamed protein product [Didymodactylos carnosus]|uniref:NAD(P)(+)--arginine ADP-ribosyltransferase n=1 Tax=Didymodactylos carnosus TaxID=1234261 RepID=A0A815CBK9_9BILA|nr:unnamed protein product [Didymodactylos carnosus]CAF4084349.1 unnamed protein product [Didymodactylos carnosus]
MGGYSKTSRNIQYSNGFLFAQCKSIEGKYIDSQLNLTNWFANHDGTLVKQQNGHFEKLCTNINVNLNGWLSCNATKISGHIVYAEINLNDFISNIDGQLTIDCENDKPNSPKVAVWYWKSNLNPFDINESAQWTKYSNIENNIIEEAFEKKQKQVVLENYMIDFEKKLQISKKSGSKQRQIKRILTGNEQNLRHERFFIEPKLMKSFGDYSMSSDFLESWIKNSNPSLERIDEILEQAINGILLEGKKLGEIADAEWCAKQLSQVQNQNKNEINRCVLKVYTTECFLYKTLNAALRENDMTKVNTLGPFCYLLNSALSNTQNIFYTGYLYRGTKLQNHMIEDYLKAVNNGCRSWPGFTSTSRSRTNAEEFGDTLFIINIIDEHSKALDISSASVFPNEEEILLPNGWNFIVEKVDMINGKNHVYLRRSKDHN